MVSRISAVQQITKVNNKKKKKKKEEEKIMQDNMKDLIIGSNARTFNNSTGHDTSAKPTGQGYGAARKGPGVRGPIEAQVKEEPREYKNNA